MLFGDSTNLRGTRDLTDDEDVFSDVPLKEMMEKGRERPRSRLGGASAGKCVRPQLSRKNLKMEVVIAERKGKSARVSEGKETTRAASRVALAR